MTPNPICYLAEFTVILLACLLLTGCASITARDAVAEISIQHGTVTPPTGCTLRYTHYQIAHAVDGDLVVLGPGFLRSRAQLADLAQSLAAAGLTTVALDFCAQRFWNGNHVRNGQDMIRLADALAARRVVYAGFSAGALAALVAGRNDPRTLGVVALDLVDADGLGARLAVGLHAPLHGLAGEPSACNANNNGLAIYAASPQATVVPIAGADHCAFESPTNWLCRLVCARADADQTAQRRDIIQMATKTVESLMRE